jgi:hypothetical protein
MPVKPRTRLPGTVEKIIKPRVPTIPEKAQIHIERADHLYREIRIENNLTDSHGEAVKLKPGAKVEVTIEAHPEAVETKSERVGSGSGSRDKSTR